MVTARGVSYQGKVVVDDEEWFDHHKLSADEVNDDLLNECIADRNISSN